MLLQRLRDYSERLELPPTLYSDLAVRYVIDLDAGGRYLGIVDTADRSTPRTRRGQLRLVPEVVKASNILAFLLCDSPGYVLGVGAEGSKAARVTQSHQAFIERIRACAEATREPAVTAVLTFLENDPRSNVILPEDFDYGSRMTFRVDGVFPVDLPSVQAFWGAANDPSLLGSPEMQCVVCGRQRPVLGRLKGKIKGVPDGQPSGTSIISANEKAFESYGLEASLIAPTCADCGERFTKAANELLGSRESRTVLAGAAFIYWTREPVAFNFMSHLTDPKADEVGALLDTVNRGGLPPDLDETRFYATVLSGSGGRAVVRDWIDTTVGEAKEKLATWFRRQAIVDPFSDGGIRPLGVHALAGATVRQLSDVPRPTTRSLLRAALTGAPLPLDLLYQAVRRNQAEQGVTRPRAALIKLVLSSQDTNSEWEDGMIQLDQDNDNPAYRCGRLLAVLEQAQRAAIPGINATIVDRFFGTASSAPASVFPRLVRGAQPHLAKLERDNRGAYVALKRRLEDIQGGLPIQYVNGRPIAYPRTLTLEQQGLFALGYYHQSAFDRQQRNEAAAHRRAAGQPAPDDEAGDLDDDETNP